MADEDSKSLERNVEAKPNVTKELGRKSFSGMSFDELDHFVNKDDQYLFCKTWKPKGEPKALLLLLHGYSEHVDWFSGLAEAIAEVGVLVFAHDYVGHGESEGYRCDVTSYEIYLRDALQHVGIMRSEYPDLPLYLYGHAMSGGLAIIFAGENPDLFKGIILSAAFIKSNFLPTGLKLCFMKLASLIMPRYEVIALEPKVFTTNVEGVEKYKNDPLVYHGKIRLRMLMQLVRISNRAQEMLSEISMPVLALHGDKDVKCDLSGPEELMRVAKSEDKTLKVYHGVLHELLYESGDIPQRFLSDIKEWLQKRISE